MDGLTFKHNERLSNVINKLKNQLTAGDNVHLNRNLSESEKNINPSREMEALNSKDGSEQLDLLDNESSRGWKSQEDKSLSKSYLMWENNANLCWLDSSMSLLVHNKSLSHLVKDNSSQISKILQGYENAISVFNDYSNESSVEERLQKAKDILQKIQETVLDYLKPILKCKEGEPDSAFCSLLNLINENKQIKNLFFVEFSWVRNCIKCAVPRVKNNKKTIITLSKVKEFNPSSPVSLYKCPFCESPDQKMEIKYKTLPECLIFHFENGAGEGELDSLDFHLNDRKYKLSGLITLEKSRDLNISHFVTWARDIATDSWLECNDLNSDILSFTVIPPLINLKEIYIVMYEALDDKGTISNISVDMDNAINMDADDTSSSDIPVIDLSDEEESTEFNQTNQINKEASNTIMEGLFKHDEINYDNDEKMSKRFDEILSDSIFSEENTLESSEINTLEYFDANCCKENNTSEKEKFAQNSELESLCLQDNALSTSSEKTDGVLLKMDVSSNSLITNTENDSKNGTENFAAVNIKPSLVKDSIKIPAKDDNKPFIFPNSDMASFVKPILNSTVKASKEITAKLSIETSSNIEKLPMLTDTKDIISEKRDIPAGLAEELLDFAVSASQYPSTVFKNQHKIKNTDCQRYSPIESQNSKLDGNVLVETNSLNMNNPFNAVGDCTQDAGESCARTSGLPIFRKEVKNNFALKKDIPIKKFKTIKNEKFTKDATVGDMDNPLTNHGVEKTVEISTFPDLTLYTPDTQEQLQKSGIHLSTLPENVSSIAVKNTNHIYVLEGKSVVNSETKIQNIDMRLPVESCIPSRKVSDDFPSEFNQESEFTGIEHNHISSNMLTTLNPTAKKSAVNLLEDKVHTNINTDVVAKHTDNSVEIFVEDDTSFIMKQNKVNVKSLEGAVSKVSENINPTSSMHQTRILNNTAAEQPEAAPASSVKPNGQLNVQSIKSQEVNEDVLLKKTLKQQMREFEERHTVASEYHLGVKNLPLKMPFVQLTRLKDSELAGYISGEVSFAEPKRSKSLEELTKTVVVKVEQTDPKSIFKRTDEQVGPSRTTKVQNVESVRKSSRIFARKMRAADKPALEIISKKKKNSLVQSTKSVSTNKALPEVAKNTSKRAYRTRSASEIHLGVSSNDHSQRNTKKKHSEDSLADEGVKSKRQRTKSIEVENSATPSHLPTVLSLKTTSSSQIVHDESDVSLKVLGSSPNEYSMPTNKNDPVTGSHIQPDNSVHELQANKQCTSDCECNDLQLHELIENTSNCVFANVFQFFNLHNI